MKSVGEANACRYGGKLKITQLIRITNWTKREEHPLVSNEKAASIGTEV
jgi:hypothetical protein